jgi:hypothetical protein
MCNSKVILFLFGKRLEAEVESDIAARCRRRHVSIKACGCPITGRHGDKDEVARPGRQQEPASAVRAHDLATVRYQDVPGRDASACVYDSSYVDLHRPDR